ncbi:MAG: peptidase M3, partial [Acidobacteriota bacterium]
MKPPHDELHAWAGELTPDSLNAWVAHHLQAHHAAIDQLLIVQEPRTVENTLAPYDRAVAALGIAGSEAGLLHSVCQQKAVRTQAEAMVQAVSEAAVQLSLNPQVYLALSSIDRTNLDAATKHYLERTLLQYRLAGVDKDPATRDKIQQLQERITELGLTFGRNVQEQGNTVAVEDAAELEGLPADFLARHAPNAEGRITLTT